MNQEWSLSPPFIIRQRRTQELFAQLLTARETPKNNSLALTGYHAGAKGENLRVDGCPTIRCCVNMQWWSLTQNYKRLTLGAVAQRNVCTFEVGRRQKTGMYLIYLERTPICHG